MKLVSPTAPASSTSAPGTAGAPVAVEIAALLGDSVIAVGHRVDPRGGRVSPVTWGVLAVSALGLASAALAFHASVAQAAADKARFERHTRVEHKPAYAFRPTAQSPVRGALGAGGLALGIAGAAYGLARLRRERKSPYYRVGTAPGVDQPLAGAPAPAFPLVAPDGDGFVCNIGPGMTAELLVGSTVTPLDALVAGGQARPSATTPGAIEVPLTLATRVRARAGQTTFVIAGVEPPRAHALPGLALERRALAYAAGSLALHLGLLAVLQTVPVEDTSANIDMASLEDVATRSATTGREEPPAPPQEEPDEPGEVGGSQDLGAKMRLEEGKAGRPDAAQADGQLKVRDEQRDPALARAEAIEAARTAGVLGSTQALTTGITALAATSDFSSGFDDANQYGAIFGADGEGRGMFGGGRMGWGPGGGCAQEPCGTIGVGRYGTIPGGGNATDGWGGPGPGGFGMRKRVALDPTPKIGPPTIDGELDKAMIRRYIRRHLTKIGYCYEKELLAKPGIAGSVGITFLIAPNGTVQGAMGDGFDAQVAQCVASVIKDIEFPAIGGGAPVQVKYPFTFHAAGR